MRRIIGGKFSALTLDKKIYFVVMSLLYSISVITLAIFSIFYVTSYIHQSSNVARDQLYSTAISYASALDSYKELAEALTIDDAIQEYLKSDGLSDSRYFELVTGAKSTLQNAQNMYPDMVFIAVISYHFNAYVYKGTVTKISSDFLRTYAEDYECSLPSRDVGTLRMSYNDAYLSGEPYLNVYFPVYSISHMINENGLLCMIFDSSLFNGLTSNKAKAGYDSDLILMHGDGMVAASTDKDMIGTSFEHVRNLTETGGTFKSNSDLYIYRKVGKWNFYLVSRIPLKNMYLDSVLIMVLLFIICVAITYVGQLICQSIIGKAYRPLNDIIQIMNRAADGELDARVNIENVGADFIKLAGNFNYMMEKIDALMEQVKLDQKAVAQLRFNALQSQIQPHFLYNALDCIHWQSSAEGHQEISTFVKALAQYYRLCLSKGHDIIPLEQELEHVRNYLVIQNIRYDNIIRGDIDMADDCRRIAIPKITIQPLVENSIYHGIKVKEGCRGGLRIEAFRKGEDMFVLVSDNGTGMTDEQILKMNNSLSGEWNEFGYGVQNVNKRIEILFGKKYGLRYERNQTGGVTVTICLPGVDIQNYEEVRPCTRP